MAIETQTITLPSNGLSQATDSAVNILVSHPIPPTQSRATLLLLPFWGATAQTYLPLLEHLQTSVPSATCISISYPGTGSSSSPPADLDTAESHSIRPLAHLVLSVLLKLHQQFIIQPNQKLIICAHSMSAKVAYVLLSLLSQTSHELDLSLSALLLFGPAPIESLIFPPEMREQSLHAYDSVESARWTIENILSSRALDAVLIESFASDCAGMSQAAKDGWLYHGMGFDCSEYLSTIWEKWQGLKVRVLVGSEDKVETVEKVREQTVQVLKAGGFDIEMDVVEGAGHLLPVEAIDEVVEALRKLVG